MVPHERARYVLRWLFIGGIAAMAVAPISALVWHGADWFVSFEAAGRWIYLLPVAGAAVVGVVVHGLLRVASGEGAPAYIASVNMRGGYVSLKLTILHLLGFVLTVGTGGSGGLVGPMTLAGGGFSNALGRGLRRFCPWLRLSRRDLSQVTICGAAAGVGSVLGAPLGGGLFAVELLSADSIEYGYLYPAIVASAVGAAVGRMCGVRPLGWASGSAAVPAAGVPPVLLAVLATAILAGVWALLFVAVYGRVMNLKTRLPYWLAPPLGAVVCVVCALVLGQRGMLGTSAPMLRTAFSAPAAVPVVVCVLMLAGKSMATVGTVGSGGNGGLTMPMLVVGGFLGTACAAACGFDGAAAQSVVAGGAAAMLSAVLNVPIAAAVICIEIFGMDHAFAAALGSAVAFAIAKTEVVYSYWETRSEQ